MKAQIDDDWAYFKECGYEAREDGSVVHPGEVSGRCLLGNDWIVGDFADVLIQLENAPELGSVVEWLEKQDWRFVTEAAWSVWLGRSVCPQVGWKDVLWEFEVRALRGQDTLDSYCCREMWW